MQGQNQGPGKFSLNSGFNSTKVRTQRFGVTNQSGAPMQNNITSPNYNVMGNYNQFSSGANTTNNANFQHKQRQLSYSPNMQAAKIGGHAGQKQNKKRNISETGQSAANAGNLMSQGIDPLHMNQVPSRRSQSKNDKYKDSGDLQNGLAFGNFAQNNSNSGGQKGASGLGGQN